ncbi:hypothetical protein K8I61_19425 [bacterium]|nr:hypothetical protein [bacterium]
MNRDRMTLGERWREPFRKHPAVRPLFFAACALFVVVRVLILETAYDHLHNIDPAVHEMPAWALGQMGRVPETDIKNYHLWSKELTATLLIPFLYAGISVTTAMAIVMLALSLAGFVALVHLVLAHAGGRAAAILALLLIFPDRNFLKWSLTMWGGYTEVVGLAGVALWFFAATADPKTPASPLAAGLACGAVAAYSNNMVYFPAALGALMLFRKSNVVAGALRFAAGAVIPWIPVALWLATWARDLPIMPKEFYLPPAAFIGYPTLAGFDNMALLLENERFFGPPIVRRLGVAGLAWALLTAFRGFRERGAIWRAAFPATALAAIGALAVFPFVDSISTRHLLWLIPAAYAGIALLLADDMVTGRMRARSSWLWPSLWRAEVIVKAAALAALVIFNAIQLAPLIQPREFGMLHRFRGMDYFATFSGFVVGPEVERVNCALDEKPRGLWDMETHAGMRTIFRRAGAYQCCIWEPDAWDASDVPPALKPGISARYWRGVGYGLALKADATAEAVDRIENLDPVRRTQILEAFHAMRDLPCMPRGPSGRPSGG